VTTEWIKTKRAQLWKYVVRGIVVLILPVPGLAVDIPLQVREEQGIAREQNPVNSGIPLPRGAVWDPQELRLLDENGKVVLASLEPRGRWLGDNSLKWVTAHFLIDRLPASGVRNYRLVTSDAPLPSSPLRVVEGEGKLTVFTGAARFEVSTRRLAPIEQVYLPGDTSIGVSEEAGLLTAPANVVLEGSNGESKVEDEVARIVGVGSRFVQPGTIQAYEVEERGPGRAVVALRGTFSTPETKSLDFTTRLYFYADSALCQMTFSVRNRQLDDMARFVGIERLAIEVPFRDVADGEASLDLDGKVVRTPLKGQSLAVLQSARNRLTASLSGASIHEGSVSDGWIALGGKSGVMTAGSRWFWQNYPKGLEVHPDGTLALELKPAASERVDLYTAGAKTHFLFFHFSPRPGVEPKAVAAGTQFPLVAVASPDWYCQETRVFGNLYSSRLENFEPRYRDLVGRFQSNLDERIRKVVAGRPREDWGLGVDEFGWLDFGSGLHHRDYTTTSSATSWWDGNYYDFPHAALVNFLRTGDLLNFRTAEEAGLHLADIDICHSFPGQPEYAGSPRSCPVIGHFRNYTRGKLYMGHDSFTFYKNESLYELYYLTGERWYRDVGLMSSDFAMAKWGKGALRNLAHGIWGVLSAYQFTHEEKYLQRARFFVEEWGFPWQDQNDGGFNDQHWMYGLVFEAYAKYYELTGDERVPVYLVKALDALIREFWSDRKGTGGLPGINVYGFGLGYQYTGREEYLSKGLQLLEQVSSPGAEGDRVKTFAQNFRSSPYFLSCLAKGK